MSTDRELLELAAKAAGIDASWDDEAERLRISVPFRGSRTMINYEDWDPLTDDGDALRLAVKLGLLISTCGDQTDASDPDERFVCVEPHGEDACAASRRAITREAAQIGRAAQGVKHV